VVSARSVAALGVQSARVAGVLAGGVGLADVAYTLQVGRRHFAHRRAIVCRDTDPGRAAAALRTAPPVAGVSARPHVAFLFPGGGSQYAGMGRELYAHEPTFRAEVDRCAELAAPLLGYDPRVFLTEIDPDPTTVARAATSAGVQVGLFIVEYALARLWMSWGVRPKSMLGHSLGEYVAACMAGVFTLDDAIATVVLRGQLIDEMPAGAMLAVSLPEAECARRLGPDLDIAAVNAPDLCVVSGLADAVEHLAGRLAAEGVDFRRLHVRTLGHSRAMEPVLDRFARHLKDLTLHEPRIPYVSNVTGTWVTAGEATDPAHWVRHLRHAVRFADGVRTLLDGNHGVLLEVGPGTALGTLLTRVDGSAPATVPSMRHPRDTQPDQGVLLTALARLWEAGVDVDWVAFSAHEKRLRVSLPTYPFERRRYWLEPPDAAGQPPTIVGDLTRAVAPDAAVAVDRSTTALDVAVTRTVHRRPELLTEFAAPSDALETRIVATWQELLGYDRIGVHDNFFALGGSSLLTTRLLARLRETFEVDLPLEELFKAHTVADQASIIRALQGDGDHESA